LGKHFEFVKKIAACVIDTLPRHPLLSLITIVAQPNVLNVNALSAVFFCLFWGRRRPFSWTPSLQET